MSALCGFCLYNSALTPLRRNALSFRIESCLQVCKSYMNKTLCLLERAPAVLLTLHILWGCIVLKENMPFYHWISQKGHFSPQMYSFTMCNKGCAYFSVVLVTVLNHAHPLFPLTPHLGKRIRNSECSSFRANGKVIPRPGSQGTLTLAPCLDSWKTSTSVSCLQPCWGATIVFVVWVIVNRFISSRWTYIV